MSDYTPPTLVIPTPGGSAGDGSINGNLTFPDKKGIVFAGGGKLVQDDYVVSGTISFFNAQGDRVLYWYGNNPTFSVDGLAFYINAPTQVNTTFIVYNSIQTVGLGVAPIYGKDVRTGLTAADASATTLYTTTAAGQVYEVTARILGTGGTITSGVYTIGWTEGGAARTASVSVTATGTLASAVFLLQPDSGTAITAQLTTLSGTSPVVNVAAILKEDV